MAFDEEQPERFTIKRDSGYDSEERLNMEGGQPDEERERKARIKKVKKALYVILGAAILALAAIIFYKYFL